MEMSQILNNPIQLQQAILYLYSRQTEAERAIASTVEDNGVGFSAYDAEILSSFAQQILAGSQLTEKQFNSARLRLPKYHRQLDTEAFLQISVPEIISSNGRSKAISPNCAGIIKVEQVRDRYGLVFFPNVYPSKQIKRIGFGHWENGCWHQNSPSINQAAINDIIKLFGDTVVISKEITEHLKPVDIVLTPEITEDPKLREYQKETIQFQLTHPHSLIALAPRLGKTVTTIYAVNAANCKKVLVVSPLSLLLDWKAKIKTWSGEQAAVVYKKQLLVPARWTITNYDTLRLHPDVFQTEIWDAIIVDETLLIKNRNAKRTNTVQALVQNVKPKYLWFLSGAPTSRLYTDLWSQLHILDPYRFSSFWRFAEKYCIVESNQWSKYNLVGNQIDAAEHIKQDLVDIYFTRSQEDVTDMPAWHIDDVPVAMSAYQDKLYATMEEQFLAELPNDNKLIASNYLAQLVRLVQIASNPLLIAGKDESTKWDAAIEMLQFEQLPAIVWTCFIETAKQLEKRLHLRDISAAKLTGATKSTERQFIVDDFQAGKLDVLVAHPGVGKYGLDLYNAKTVIYLERDYNGDNYYQSLNRVRHIDQKVSPHIIHLLSERSGDVGGGTVDHVINKVLQGKRKATMALTSAQLRKLFEE